MLPKIFGRFTVSQQDIALIILTYQYLNILSFHSETKHNFICSLTPLSISLAPGGLGATHANWLLGGLLKLVLSPPL